VSDGVHI